MPKNKKKAAKSAKREQPHASDEGAPSQAQAGPVPTSQWVEEMLPKVTQETDKPQAVPEKKEDEQQDQQHEQEQDIPAEMRKRIIREEQDEAATVAPGAAPGAAPSATPGAAPGATPGAAPGATPGATAGAAVAAAAAGEEAPKPEEENLAAKPDKGADADADEALLDYKEEEQLAGPDASARVRWVVLSIVRILSAVAGAAFLLHALFLIVVHFILRL